MSKQEVLETFRGQYRSFCQSLSQTQLLAIISTHSLGDFPGGLPPELGKPLKAALTELEDKFNQAAAVWKETPGIDQKIDLDLSQENESAFNAFVLLAVKWLLSSDLINSTRTIDNAGSLFRATACHQAVAMLYAHLDGFLNDAARAICLSEPTVLKSKRQATWEKLLDFRSIDELRRHLVSEYVDSFSRKGVLTRLDLFQSKLGLKLDIPEENDSLLRLYEKRRHLIIHNAGVATSNYISESEDPKAAAGELVLIEEEDVRELAEIVQMTGSKVFRAIVNKFLDVDPTENTIVWD